MLDRRPLYSVQDCRIAVVKSMTLAILPFGSICARALLHSPTKGQYNIPSWPSSRDGSSQGQQAWR
jgi:hypothetical protein